MIGLVERDHVAVDTGRAAMMIRSLPDKVAARAGVLLAGQLTALIWLTM